MKKTAILITALMLSACATGYNPQEAEAVRDYIAANKLEEVDRVRTGGQFNYTYVNDYFVTIRGRGGSYLAEFVSECRELRRQDFSPDMWDQRRDHNWLRARFDTIRGCRIDTLYVISEEQRRELRELGDAPGDEVFLPEDEDS